MYSVKKLRSAAAFALLIAVMALFLSAPAHYAAVLLDGISLWAVCILPTTFPFLILTALMTETRCFSALSRRISRPMGALYALPGRAGGALLLALLSGYPVGARLTADLSRSGALSQKECFRLACLSSTSGPVFLVGTVGGVMFGSTKAGWILFFSHILAVWGSSLLLRGRGGGRTQPPVRQESRSLYDILSQAILSILCVGGLICLFYCLADMLQSILPCLSELPPLAQGALTGLVEMTAGCRALSAAASPLSLPLAAALITLGGACILCQEMTFLSPVGIKLLPFLAVKAAQAILTFALCLALSLWLL